MAINTDYSLLLLLLVCHWAYLPGDIQFPHIIPNRYGFSVELEFLFPFYSQHLLTDSVSCSVRDFNFNILE